MHLEMGADSTIEIDLDALVRNVGRLRSVVGPECGLCAVVKADAYGLGAPIIARTMVRAGVDLLAVYSTWQVEALAEMELRAPILTLAPIRSIARGSILHQLLLAGRLHIVVHDLPHARTLESIGAALGCDLPVHAEFDSGMGRGGCASAEAMEVLQLIAKSSHLRLVGVMTHFSEARLSPTRTADQLNALDELLREAGDLVPRRCVVHAANSHALLRDESTHRSMVRFGLAWTGLAGDELPSGNEDHEAYEPIVRWTSRINQVRRLERGESVGYGSLWTANRPSTIALIPVGYADGFPSTPGMGNATNGPAVRVKTSSGGWFVAPLVGAVNMDQIAVDLTGSSVWCTDPQRALDAEVEVYGRDRSAPTHIVRVAELSSTRPYELLCRLNARIPRAHFMSKGGDCEQLDSLENPNRRDARPKLG
ncbi:MAG: alanine racemase [Planctomycetota bacterium]|nr:alanine racemase [Planctomycetota bacterium]